WISVSSAPEPPPARVVVAQAIQGNRTQCLQNPVTDGANDVRRNGLPSTDRREDGRDKAQAICLLPRLPAPVSNPCSRRRVPAGWRRRSAPSTRPPRLS